MMEQPIKLQQHGKYDNSGKGRYFRFDYDHKMSNKNLNERKFEWVGWTHTPFLVLDVGHPLDLHGHWQALHWQTGSWLGFHEE